MINREAGVFQTSYQGDMALYPLPLAKIAFWGTVGILLLLPWPLAQAGNEHVMSIVNTIVLASIGAIGLNILTGYTGQISLGQGAFMAVGGYTAAILSSRYGMPFWFGILAGGGMAALVGALFGIPSLRIKGLYLAVATLAAQLIIEWTINHVSWFSGGVQASIEVPRPSVFGTVLKSLTQLYLFLMFFFVLAIVTLKTIVGGSISS